MVVFVPYNTDAPLYHFPFATIGLIAVNTLVFIVTAHADPLHVDIKVIAPWVLHFGDGLHPEQWITCNFLHADILHLLGNMFFLWGFGLVVEGKLGWWRFLLLYLAIGFIFGGIVQLAMLGAKFGVGLGASGVIFGLMMIALVWAPKNEMNCALLIAMRFAMFDLPITIFATIFLVFQFAAAWLTGFAMSTPILHLMGGGVGLVFGVALLKLNLVDCEGWDLFAVWAGREGTAKLTETVEAPVPATRLAFGDEDASILTKALRSRLIAGDAMGAARFYQKQRRARPEWNLEEPDLMTLIKSLHQQKLYDDALMPMVDFLRLFPDRALRIRLKLADILITHKHRSTKALQVLSKIDTRDLPADLQPVYEKLKTRAEKHAEEQLEPQDDDEW